MQFKMIKLKAEWLGHPKGSVLTLQSAKADDLMSRGCAAEVDVDKPTEKGPTTPSAETKEVERPAVDKMVKRPTRSK